MPVSRRKYAWIAGIACVALLALYAVGRVIHNPMAVMAYALTLAVWVALTAYALSGEGGVHSLQELGTSIPYGSWVFIIVSAFIFMVISHEKYIYIWDYGWYHELSIVFSTNYLTDTPAALSLLYDSINVSEYNYVLPLLLSFPMRIFGPSRLSYLLSVWACFGLPTAAVLSYGVQRYAQSLGAAKWLDTLKPPVRKALRGLLLLLISLWPWLLVPLMRGYIDIGALLTASCLVVITLTRMDWKRFSFKTNTVIAALLLLVIFERRYFSLFAVGYVAGLAAHALCALCAAPREERKKTFWTIFFSFLYIGGLCLSVLLIFFRGFLEMSLMKDYADAYEAFSSGSILQNADGAVQTLGKLWVAVALLGCVITLIRKRGKAPGTIFLLVSALVTLVAFGRIQSFGEHHCYVVTAQLVLLTAGSVLQIVSFLRIGRVRLAALALALVCLAGNVLYAYGGSRRVSLRFLGMETYYPMQRSDLDALRELDAQLRQLTKNNDMDAYIIGSSFTLNSDILRKLHFPPSTNTEYPLLTEGSIDLRDGFPTDFLRAELMIVGDPPQGNEKTQRVVTLLHAEVVNPASPIGRHFAPVGEPVTLDNGVVVTLYQKNSLFTSEDLEYLQVLFDAYFSDYPKIFRDRIVMENQD